MEVRNDMCMCFMSLYISFVCCHECHKIVSVFIHFFAVYLQSNVLSFNENNGMQGKSLFTEQVMAEVVDHSKMPISTHTAHHYSQLLLYSIQVNV